jgi:transposase
MPWRKSEPMERRIEFALKAMQTLNFRALCQEYGVSTKTGYKWRERFVLEGLAGMKEESRRPKSSPIQLAEEEVCEIVRLKVAHWSWGRARFGSSIYGDMEKWRARAALTSVGAHWADTKAPAPLE